MIPLGFALLVALVATIHDFRTRRIPDWLTFSAAIVGAFVHVVAARAAVLPTLLSSVVGAVACGALPFVFARQGKLGLGDVKLFLALGAILGPALGFEAQVYAFAFAFPAALVLRRRKIDWLPFAPAIFAGVLVAAIMQA